MLLLDEKTEVLQLVTNSLKNDLQHSNQFIAGLSLAVGNLATADMERMLAPQSTPPQVGQPVPAQEGVPEEGARLQAVGGGGSRTSSTR